MYKKIRCHAAAAAIKIDETKIREASSYRYRYYAPP
jgi:hypothetical protein